MSMGMRPIGYGRRGQTTTEPAGQFLYDEGLRRHMLQVYNYMGLGLVLTGLVAVVVGTTPALYVPIFSTPLKWVAILAPLPFALFFAFRVQSISASSAQALFWAFCGVMGLSLASIFLVFTGQSVARTFFIAAAMFGVTSLYTARPFDDWLFPHDGAHRRRDREPREHPTCIKCASVHRFGGRNHCFRWPNRVGYPVNQGTIRRAFRGRVQAEARGPGRLLALPKLCQHVPAASEFFRSTRRVTAHGRRRWMPKHGGNPTDSHNETDDGHW